MLAYAGVDFTNPRNRNCNKRKNPHFANGYFGRDVSLFEVVFVKNTGTPVNMGRMSPQLVADIEFYSTAKLRELQRYGRPLLAE